MNSENEKKLQQTFPKFFEDFYGDPTITGLAFGIETDDGWFDLIFKLCEDLKRVAPPDFYVAQVKSKYGTLRFYTYCGNEETDALIDKAERESAHTCELCGSKEAKLCGTSWYYTLCEQCRIQHKIEPLDEC